MVLGITDNRKPSFENYLRWIRHAALDAEIVKLKPPRECGCDHTMRRSQFAKGILEEFIKEVAAIAPLGRST